MFTVPDNSGADPKHSGKKGSSSEADAAKQQPLVSNELTPRLQELHARIEASASSAAAVAAASALSLTTSVNSVTTDGTVGLPSSVGSAEEALGLSATGSSAAKLADGPASNEQLIECFKVLLPELDRLRFDDHTKKSIRATFRKLKEAAEQQALDRKRGALKKPQPLPPAQSQFQQAMAQQQHSLQELQQLQQQQIQQMQQQLMMQSEQQAMAMAAQASQIGENTVL